MKRNSSILLQGVVFITLWLWFSISIPFHLRFQELYQMFLFSVDYFKETVFMPGGLGVYLGRFLTQFFLFPAIGALIIALLFLATQILTYKTLRPNNWGLALSFLPALLLALYFNDANALLSTYIAAIAALAFALIPFRNKLIATGLSLILYFCFGPLAVGFYAVALSLRKGIFTGCIALCAGFVGVISMIWCSNFPLQRLVTGIHYNRYHDSIPLLPYLSLGSFLAICVFIRFVKKTPSKFLLYFLYILILASTSLAFIKTKNTNMEELCQYGTLAREENWNEIINLASKKKPTSPLSQSCLNLALAQADACGEWMFRYPQMGPDGMFYPYRREHISPMISGLIYWHLGLLNTSQRFSFAAEEVIPDFQKSAWAHKRLTEIYLCDANIMLARKRLEPLKYTLFYRKWALNTEKLLDNPELIDSVPLYRKIRSNTLKDYKHTYNLSDFYPPLEALVKTNPENRIARQYLLAWSLLNGDLDNFARFVEYDMEHINSKAYQEAYILYWSAEHNSPEGMPDFVSQKTLQRYMMFDNSERFRDTYWYYFFNK